MIDSILKTSEIVTNKRNVVTVSVKFAEEAGEVMGEISKILGHTKYKEVVDTGLVEEIADSIIAAVDLGYMHYGDAFKSMLEKAINNKLDKWYEKYSII